MITTVDPHAVAESVAAIRERIRALAGDRDVHLVAVTKGFGADALLAAAAAGCTMVGENYAQELVAKIHELSAMETAPSPSEPAQVPPGGLPQVHFIGQLQTNKVRQIAHIVGVWQTVDRSSLADELVRRAPGATVFIQVNATGEADKGGCPPDQVAALVQHCQSSRLRVEGLMTVGPTSQDLAATTAAFSLVRRLADDNGLSGCSMGMSADMDIAIEHGATHVRIGTAVFGARPHRSARIR